jgi:hypothetical protein
MWGDQAQAGKLGGRVARLVERRLFQIFSAMIVAG